MVGETRGSRGAGICVEPVINLFLVFSAALLICAQSVIGAESESVPRRTPAAKGFRIKNGFRIEVAATTPMVASPVAMAFDENGRLFVVEMPGYAGPEGAGNVPGRVRLLEDQDGDGVFDSSTIYADNLLLPSAIACYDGGIYVAAGGDLIYIKNASNVNAKDVRKVVLSGFGGKRVLRPPQLINNFC